MLDIGCGWGGLAFALATLEPEAKVTSITLSENQIAFASIITTGSFACGNSILLVVSIFLQSQAGMVCQLQLSHTYHATPLGRRYIIQ